MKCESECGNDERRPDKQQEEDTVPPPEHHSPLAPERDLTPPRPPARRIYKKNYKWIDVSQQALYNNLERYWYKESKPIQYTVSRGGPFAMIEKKCSVQIVDNSVGEQSKITIASPNSVYNIDRAIQHLDKFVGKPVINRTKFTHFIAIPVEFASTNYVEFCQRIMENPENCYEDLSKRKGLFYVEENLHITVCMLSCPDEETKDEAQRVLSDIIETEIKPLAKDANRNIEIRGLRCFEHDNPAKARVVFAEVHNEIIQQIADTIANGMRSRTGLAPNTDRSEQVVLHMTVANCSKARNPHKFKKFDARQLITDYADYHFGDSKLNMIKIFNLFKQTGESTMGYEALFEMQI